MFEPFLERWSKAYQAEVGGELRKYGLRVDDLLDPDSHPVRPHFFPTCRYIHYVSIAQSPVFSGTLDVQGTRVGQPWRSARRKERGMLVACSTESVACGEFRWVLAIFVIMHIPVPLCTVYRHARHKDRSVCL